MRNATFISVARSAKIERSESFSGGMADLLPVRGDPGPAPPVAAGGAALPARDRAVGYPVADHAGEAAGAHRPGVPAAQDGCLLLPCRFCHTSLTTQPARM